MEDDNLDYDETSKFIELVKKNHGIEIPNHQMTDDEIRRVIRAIVNVCTSPILEDDKQPEPDCSPLEATISLMLALHFWPNFYEKWKLSQNN